MKLSPKELEKRRILGRKVLTKLKKLFPDAGMILKYSNNWELLVAVILSAQCTDKQVNKVTEKLFKKYRTLDDYVRANPREFENDIISTGFYKNKTKNIIGAAKVVKENFGGTIPRTMEGMLTIPGVGRKTANVVLGNAYGIVLGIAVDTHVKRLAQVLGLTTESTPEKIEQDLMEIFPRDDWFKATYLLIEYGRRYCSARRHNHISCPLTPRGEV